MNIDWATALRFAAVMAAGACVGMLLAVFATYANARKDPNERRRRTTPTWAVGLCNVGICLVFVAFMAVVNLREIRDMPVHWYVTPLGLVGSLLVLAGLARVILQIVRDTRGGGHH